MSTNDVLCVVDNCQTAPTGEMTVNHDGLMLVYAVCEEHERDIRWGSMMPRGVEQTRGLIGPA